MIAEGQLIEGVGTISQKMLFDRQLDRRFDR
jgi:hypothetical protein